MTIGANRAIALLTTLLWLACQCCCVEILATPVQQQPAWESGDFQESHSPEDDAVVAQPGPTAGEWTLARVTAIAAANHPAIQRAEFQVAAAEGRRLQSSLPANPSIGFEGQQLFSGGVAEQYGVLWERELIRREKLFLNASVGGHEVERMRWRAELVRRRVQADASLSFISILAAQESLRIAGQLEELSTKAVELTGKLFEASEVSRNDLLKARIEANQARMMRVAAASRLNAAMQTLVAQCNLPPSESPGTVVGNLYEPIPGFNSELVANQLEADLPGLLDHPAIAELQTAILSAQCRVERERVETMPNINAAALLNWRDNGIGGAPDAGLRVSLPIAFRNRNQGAIAEARNDLAAQQNELSSMQLELRQRLAEVLGEYTAASKSSAIMVEMTLPMSEESIALSRQAFEAGESNFIDLLIAIRTNVTLQNSLIDTLEQLRRSEIELTTSLVSSRWK